ncbi:type-2 ice-structuring protein-like [Cheilinus undulatus]|uniref:type-2 ice-structuring protein-like n=1 Tax=Cheilinus undulatus TaxID=241271 RepID=UPI001BD4C294|nr:type-2 ice-structuring protein-like [Cheilinus undulatus]
MKLLAVSALVCALMALSRADAAAEPEPQEVKAAAVEPEPQAKKEDASVAKRTCLWHRIGHRYFYYVYNLLTWQQAEAYCHSLGGHLASVHSLWEFHLVQAFVRKQTHGNPEVWLGGNDIHQEGVWRWTDGSCFNFHQWCCGDPNNSNNQDCLQMNYSVHKCWDDIQCNVFRPSVCARLW